MVERAIYRMLRSDASVGSDRLYDMDRQPDEIPGPLFHYTTTSGLTGIVQTKQLWATSIQYMNDASELTLAMQTVVRLLRAAGVREYDEDLLQKFLVSDPDMIFPVTVCAVCFSTEGDLLSQWRAYSASGAGYALEFRGPELAEAAQRKGWQLARCRYTAQEHEELLAPLVKMMLIPESGRGTTESFWSSFLQIAALIKHPGFREEREWRLVSGKIQMRELRFRAGPSMVIPFEPLDLVGLERVRVGPHRHQDLAVAAASAYLVRDAVVDASAIPYRSLL